MHCNLWHKSEAGRLPRPVKEYMRRKFDLLPEYLDTLRYFECDRPDNEKEVIHVCIFSPYIGQEHNLTIRTGLDLEQHPEMVLYEGHIDSQGNIYIADRWELIMKEKAL